MNSRKLATKVLDSVLHDGAYSNIALNNAFKTADLDVKDKGLVTEIVYGTIKYKQSIDDIISLYVKDINKIDKEIINVLRSAIYQIKYLDKIPPYAAVNEAVNIAKKHSMSSSKFVNGVLRNFLRNKDKEPSFKDNKSKMAFNYSFPKWLVEFFMKQYGEDIAMDILKGLNMTPKITVRVNSLKTNYEELFEELETEGYDVSEGYASPDAIVINRGSSIEGNKAFREGKIFVQDESAMLVSSLLDLEENMKVADLCSAPGGKSTHIAELMNNIGEVYSFDIHSNKLSLIKDNAKRLGIEIIKTEEQDATEYNSSLENTFDRVLLDVPCSGLGIIRKKPEIKWQKDLKSLKEIQSIQKKILDNAWKYLKPGGIMVYSTCTLNKAENEENVRYLLNNNEDCQIEKIYIGTLPNFIYNEEGTLTILPNEYMDGFFIGKLRKRQV
ncbi:16S rRNA (cytosine(967)-C(5))-methyltransferase RsmB [Clostridium sp. 'White wine YQ']|uniref:16S rRNA (cytosine(967)-C(5))-methyltransferase RsmB n=1 Tax=Clostridium sp. 'White wine YQ' TaxID=3027474 RepID=UPI002366BF35|nr:16S rRNA (cytosine(967)-C(5))-methyltransferase RsmB [Clostridium sp. 'White wine YQ']MDD7793742.1 16S rRNA (cytosine(967)-C(5))-methyltransferase RsmB [Clostridium sp. 'White wine YQ']